MKIRFVRDTYPRESEQAYAAGDVIECSPASAMRWVVRGAAEIVDDGADVTREDESLPDADAVVEQAQRKRARRR